MWSINGGIVFAIPGPIPVKVSEVPVGQVESHTEVFQQFLLKGEDDFVCSHRAGIVPVGAVGICFGLGVSPIKASEFPQVGIIGVNEIVAVGIKNLIDGPLAVVPPEELVDRKIIIVYNLQPAKLMGVESQGMLLAASGKDGKPYLLSVADEAQPGFKIK